LDVFFSKFDERGNWVGHSFDGKLLPQDVRDTLSLYFADLNGDGKGRPGQLICPGVPMKKVLALHSWSFIKKMILTKLMTNP
jgi:hypothetical protein